jgi:hypothetical protein
MPIHLGGDCLAVANVALLLGNAGRPARSQRSARVQRPLPATNAGERGTRRQPSTNESPGRETEAEFDLTKR